MRRIRPLLLFAIAGILTAVGASYYFQRSLQKKQAPPLPQSIPQNMNATANDWVRSKTEGSRTIWEVRAGSFRQLNGPSRFELEKVRVRVFDKNGKSFDEVKSAKAQFDIEASLLSSEGVAEITMGLPADGRKKDRLVFIKTSGLKYDGKTGMIYTDQPVEFTFEEGHGKARGASYDPNARELHLKAAAEFFFQGSAPADRWTKVESDEAVYKEGSGIVVLSPWSRMVRADMMLEAGVSTITIDKGNIRRVDAVAAHGFEHNGERRVDYAADNLTLQFANGGFVETIQGEGKARLSSVKDEVATTIWSNQLELKFTIDGKQSSLASALGHGNVVVESKPVRRTDRGAEDTRVLRSDTIELHMLPGGQEIESVRTHAPASIEFIPNQATGRRRFIEAERLVITYAQGNRIRMLTATNASTRTDAPLSAGKRSVPPTFTRSKELTAEFDLKTGDVSRLTQSGDFHYEQGDRKGTAKQALLEVAVNRITLYGSARLWDPEGSVSAERIILDQKTGDTLAEGDAAAMRMPTKASGKPSALLSEEQPIQARAQRIKLSGDKRVSRYEGNAVLWQGGNRIEADWVEIDRRDRRLSAGGHVRNQLLDTRTNAKETSEQQPVFSVVEAPSLVYADETRTAHYQGGVTLIRKDLRVTSAELRIVLSDPDSGSGLDQAYADGGVQIIRSTQGRTQKGIAEHAAYYASEGKLVLFGGQPQLEDSLRGYARGNRLTLYPDDDRLLVNGSNGQPSLSMIHRK